MKQIIDIAYTVAILDQISEIKSKVQGRRNWSIVYDNRGIIYSGGFGEGERKGMYSWWLRDMAERQIKILFFTYKKDYLKALNQIIRREV